jgi:hypothetical protein
MLLEKESSPTLIIIQRRQNDKKKPKIFFKCKKKKETKGKRKGKEGLSLLKRRKNPLQIQGPHDMHDSQGNITKLESSSAITFSQPLKESWKVCAPL